MTESVWDYPRPPRVEPSDEHVVVEHGGHRIADTYSALRVLETSHPPTYYLPATSIATGVLQVARSGRRSVCEFKGVAWYWDLVLDDGIVRDVAWTYPRPAHGFDALVEHVAFYPGRVDLCQVDGEAVRAQDGDFYGGWITSRVAGPFKGGVGTRGW